MNKVLSLIAYLATFALGRTNGAETYLIQDGKAKAEIVLSAKPSKTRPKGFDDSKPVRFGPAAPA